MNVWIQGNLQHVFHFAFDQSRFASDGNVSRCMLFSLSLSLSLDFSSPVCLLSNAVLFFKQSVESMTIALSSSDTENWSQISSRSGVQCLLLPGTTCDDYSLCFLLETYRQWHQDPLAVLDCHRDWLGLLSCHVKSGRSALTQKAKDAGFLGGSIGGWNLHSMGPDGCLCPVPSHGLLTGVIACSTVIVSFSVLVHFSCSWLDLCSLLYVLGVTNRTQ